ncbi:hypothetical protein E2C01_097258 [Portunus trituberculatus]|uniref:Secreted protein n=1 Tax=Portunus trituberculatus TaxID=210409 RepID=A0A5B7K932_PORTR|nr:hypothetical protein [Portunus trituberculatus]
MPSSSILSWAWPCMGLVPAWGPSCLLDPYQNSSGQLVGVGGAARVEGKGWCGLEGEGGRDEELVGYFSAREVPYHPAP